MCSRRYSIKPCAASWQSKISTADAGKAAEILVPFLADKSTQVQQAASAAILKFGKEAARVLASQGWRVIGTGRDAARCAAAEAEIGASAADGGSFGLSRYAHGSQAIASPPPSGSCIG